MNVARLVVPLDGSRAAESALTLAPSGVGSVVLLRVIDDEAKRAEAASYLERLRDSVAGARDISCVVVVGEPVDEIARAATAESMVVMATRARSGLMEWLRPGISPEVVRRGQAPVILVGPKCEPAAAGNSGPLLACVGGRGVRAASLARAWAAQCGLEVVLVRVVRRRAELAAAQRDLGLSSERMMARFRRRDIPVTEEWIAGFSRSRAIVDLARERSAAAVVMATYRRPGLDALVAGSLTTQVVQRSECPVLVAGPDWFPF